MKTTKKITVYNSQEMLDSQIIENWTISSGSFKDDSVVIDFLQSEIYECYDKLKLYKKGRNPINDPHISFEDAEKIANETFQQKKFENIKYQGKKKEQATLCYMFSATKEGSTHTHSAEIYINAKTGDVYNYAECN